MIVIVNKIVNERQVTVPLFTKDITMSMKWNDGMVGVLEVYDSLEKAYLAGYTESDVLFLTRGKAGGKNELKI